ncbi:MAG TPA: PQQ-binding-like beta-propeller repeat protein [Propionicimonas sp.]|nr:PQQ-binding-like beta-propeller repeat protein [Propionicimonas sp.]
MSHNQNSRRALAALLGISVSLGLAACAVPDGPVTPGERPNRPTASASASVNPETDPAKLTISLSQVPAFRPATADADGWTTNAMTDAAGDFKWRVLDADNQVIQDYQGDQPVAFGDPETYTDVPGVLTFRGNNARNGGAYGTPDVKDKKLQVVWTQDTGEVRGDNSYWPGAGWTGQPLLVNWPEATRKAMGYADEFANDPEFTEVIYPTFTGMIYRLDLATGKQTKPPIDTGCGYKGTGSVDPRGYPLLYAGQGLDDMNGVDCPFQYRVFDLIKNVQVAGWSGKDDGAPRQGWGAFDSSALVNAASDTLFAPAENGLVYKAKLNAKFDAEAKTVSVDPQLTKLQYSTPVSEKYGIESSAVAYRNLMFAQDNDGNLICWDANTLTVVWARALGDDSDASLVLEQTADGGVFLYAGNEVDKRTDPDQFITNLRKINALTGELVWQYDVPAQRSLPNNGGLMATPLLGTGEIADLVLFNVAKTTSEKQGDLIALDRKTGKLAWKRHLKRYSWSSPTQITSSDGHAYVVFGDSGGTLHLIDPNTGEDLNTLSLGKNTEASVSAYGDMLVVASYAKRIWGIRIS